MSVVVVDMQSLEEGAVALNLSELSYKLFCSLTAWEVWEVLGSYLSLVQTSSKCNVLRLLLMSCHLR